jgi:glycosyltransferase involved in cell wall biosynthesis
MKILQVIPRYLPQSGGVETHVKEISERLVDRGHDVTVMTADAGEEGSHRERRNGVQIKRYRSVAPSNAIHFCPQLFAAVRTTRSDIVHAHNYHSFPLVFAALGTDDRQFVVTPHYHGGSANSIRDRLLSVYRPLGQWAVRRANVVIAVSDWERDRLSEDFGIEATVIPNGVAVDRFAEATPVERDRPFLLTVGRLEEYKGVQHVIRAMTALPGYDLVVAGKGPHREELEEISRKEGVKNQVEFLGYVDDGKLPNLYAGAEIYITTSEFEAYGMTVAEALASGTPCIVSEDAALQGWAQHPSVACISDISAREIKKAIRIASEEKIFNNSIKTWDEVTEKIENVYKTKF